MLGGDVAEIEVQQSPPRRPQHEVHVVVADREARLVQAAEIEVELAPDRRQGQGIARDGVDQAAIGRVGVLAQGRLELVIRGRRKDVAIGADPPLGVLQAASDSGDPGLQRPGAELFDQRRVLQGHVVVADHQHLAAGGAGGEIVLSGMVERRIVGQGDHPFGPEHSPRAL